MAHDDTRSNLNPRKDDDNVGGNLVGEGVGGVSGIATGAALGSLGGPVGTVIGALAGAIGGWWSGRAISEAAASYTDDDDSHYQNHYKLTPSRTASTSSSAAAGAAGAAAGGAAAAQAATGTIHEVKMIGDEKGYRFEPANITVKQGDGVKFTMVSGGPHNVAFDPAAIPGAGKDQLNANIPNQASELSSQMLMNANENFTISFAGVAPGAYNYHCTPHLAMNMKGVVTVQ
jgi:plastocyanin